MENGKGKMKLRSYKATELQLMNSTSPFVRTKIRHGERQKSGSVLFGKFR